MAAWVLPDVTCRYLECYLVFSYLGVTWVVILGCKIPASLKLKLLKRIFFHLEMLPGPAPVLVTWLPGPPSEKIAKAGQPDCLIAKRHVHRHICVRVQHPAHQVCIPVIVHKLVGVRSQIDC